jgi:hypothetical protein
MDEATHSILPQPTPVIAPAIRARMDHAVMTLARQRAIKATKLRLRGMGLKPQHMPLREIIPLAEEYLAEHRAVLVAEAKVVVDKWTAEGFFGKRAALAAHNLRVSFNSEAGQ